MPSNYSDITADHIASLDLADRKGLGQYMTPAFLGDKMAAMLAMRQGAPVRVIDPACGTGELLLAVQRANPGAGLHGFDVDEGMITAAQRNLPDADVRRKSIFDASSRLEWGKFDYVIGNPPYFEMRKDASELTSGGVDGFASLEDKGRLNIYALFVEYALRLVRIGGKVVYLVPPSMNNGAFFKCLRKRLLELGYVEDISMVRENDSFSDALTSVQIISLVRTDAGYESNLERSSKFACPMGDTVIFTDKKDVIERFSENKKPIGAQGFKVETGSVVWNKHKGEFLCGESSDAGIARAGGGFEAAPRDGFLPVLFSKDISKDNALALSSCVSAPGHWLPASSARADSGLGIVVNRIVGSLDNPRLRFALVELDRFFGENHVNVITRPDGDDAKVRALYDALSAIDSVELSEYLKAVTGNTQLSATELGLLPVAEI